MVISMAEINKEEVRRLFDNDLLRAYAYVIHYGDGVLSVSTKQAKAFLAHLLSGAGFTPVQIRSMADVSPYISRKTEITPSKSFKKAVMALDSITAILEKAEDYAVPVRITRGIVEEMLVEDLFLSNWSTGQISCATGVHRRRVQRIIKKYRENT